MRLGPRPTVTTRTLAPGGISRRIAEDQGDAIVTLTEDGIMKTRRSSRNAAGAIVTCCALVVLSACGGSPSSPSFSSLSVGQWAGTTEHGTPITFTVSSDEILTTIAVGYSFNGCSGTQTFSNLSVATVPNLTCIPGPCSGAAASYRSFAYVSGSIGAGPLTSINGLFLPGNRAEGLVSFRDFPGCGTVGGVPWSATRR